MMPANRGWSVLRSPQAFGGEGATILDIATAPASAARDEESEFRERWMMRAQAIARDLAPTFKVDWGRPVLRSRRPDEGKSVGSSNRWNSNCWSRYCRNGSRRRARVLNASRPFRYEMGHQGCQWQAGPDRLPGIGNAPPSGRDSPSHGNQFTNWPDRMRQLLDLYYQPNR